MPGFDGTGPRGMGPMTGGARGWCNPYNAGPVGYRAPFARVFRPIRPFYPGPVRGYPAYGWGRPGWGLRFGGFGRGWGGRGRGRGWRW